MIPLPDLDLCETMINLDPFATKSYGSFLGASSSGRRPAAVITW
jgi:hypothetical protein